MQQESVDSKKVLRPDGSFMEWFLTPNVQFGLLAILTVLGLFLPFTMLLSILILPPLMVALRIVNSGHRCECRKTAKCSTTP